MLWYTRSGLSRGRRRQPKDVVRCEEADVRYQFRELYAVLVAVLILGVGPALAQPCTPLTISRIASSDSAGAAEFGWSAALSSDGPIAAVGSDWDNSGIGAITVLGRLGRQWAPLRSKLVAADGQGATRAFGRSISISDDGGTVLVGASEDNSGVGAAHVFVRIGQTWSQQGSKLVGTDRAGLGNAGWSVALSSDGNTAAVGAYNDNATSGAVFVFVRSGTTWTQQGPKLTPTGATGSGVNFGISVALSADGNSLLAGAQSDNGGTGAVFAFTRSGSTWTQQAKLLATGGGGASPLFGVSGALNADATTAIIGARNDNSQTGAAYVFTRSGSNWTQQGSKLTPIGGTGAGLFGQSVAINSAGDLPVIGAYADNSSRGAAYLFTRSAGTWAQLGSK